MLRNPVYKGDHVVCKCHQKAIRSNTYNFVPRDEWEIIENCHEAIVSREQWDRVQKLIDRRLKCLGILQGHFAVFDNVSQHKIVKVASLNLMAGASVLSRFRSGGKWIRNDADFKVSDGA